MSHGTLTRPFWKGVAGPQSIHFHDRVIIIRKSDTLEIVTIKVGNSTLLAEFQGKLEGDNLIETRFLLHMSLSPCAFTELQ